MKYDVKDRLIEFAVTMIDPVGDLPGKGADKHMLDQLVRHPCTSPVPKQRQGRSAESRKDFIQKVKMSLRELNDARVWLGIIFRKALMQRSDKVELELSECQEMIRVLADSIVTAESKRKA